MGRTLAAIAFLGVLAWCGWWILGRGGPSADEAPPSTDGGTVAAVEMAPNSLADNGRPAPESAALRSRLQRGQAEEALNEARSTLDDAKREELLRKATEIAMTDLGVIPVFYLANTWAVKSDINYAGRSDGYTLPYYVKPN